MNSMTESQECWGPGPISAGTAGDAALWGGSIAVVGMAANPFGAHPAQTGILLPALTPKWKVGAPGGRPAIQGCLTTACVQALCNQLSQNEETQAGGGAAWVSTCRESAHFCAGITRGRRSRCCEAIPSRGNRDRCVHLTDMAIEEKLGAFSRYTRTECHGTVREI